LRKKVNRDLERTTTLLEKTTKTESEWREVLSEEQFKICRKKGTEQAFSGKYWDCHDRGNYHCTCCGTPYPLGVMGASKDMTALDRIFAELVSIPLDKVYALQAARLKQFGQFHVEDMEIFGVSDYQTLVVDNFKQAYPIDISFNPLKLVKSFLKQFYEVGIKENLFTRGGTN
jgi:hypothetical protein